MTPAPSCLPFTTVPHLAPFGTTGRHYTGQRIPVKGFCAPWGCSASGTFGPGRGLPQPMPGMRQIRAPRPALRSGRGRGLGELVQLILLEEGRSPIACLVEEDRPDPEVAGIGIPIGEA